MNSLVSHRQSRQLAPQIAQRYVFGLGLRRGILFPHGWIKLQSGFFHERSGGADFRFVLLKGNDQRLDLVLRESLPALNPILTKRGGDGIRQFHRFGVLIADRLDLQLRGITAREDFRARPEHRDGFGGLQFLTGKIAPPPDLIQVHLRDDFLQNGVRIDDLDLVLEKHRRVRALRGQLPELFEISFVAHHADGGRGLKLWRALTQQHQPGNAHEHGKD